ncbi:MAG: hypothetical protein KAR39_00275 [Thermoplasmata archaeon]|nr:hypothetical protein [Thermoplasmata archaeon]
MERTSRGVGSVGKLILVVLMLLTAVLSEMSFTATAPPPAGTLNVTWENLAPDTNTFQGDVNLSMLWLSLEAVGADITLYSIQVDVFGLPPQGIDRVFLWDDRNYDRDVSYAECVIGEDSTPPYVLPPIGDMKECTGFLPGIPVVIEKNRSRYFSVMLDLYFDPLQTLTDTYLRVCVDAGYISSSAASVVGLPACSRTIDVNTRFFYDDMEQGQGNWTFSGGDDGSLYPDGLWHLSYPGEEICINNLRNMSFSHSGNTSWYYGHNYLWFGDRVCNYYTNHSGAPLLPTRNWGKLTSPWIDARLGTSLSMTVYHFLSRELYNGVDLAEVYLYDGSTWTLITSEWFTDDQWKKLTLNLSEYAGLQVKLEFRFDTMDTLNNLFIGWMIDDLAVYGELLGHDIAVTELSVPDFVPLEPQNISARVSNIGGLDESNIEVNLNVDGALADQQVLPFLGTGDTTKVYFNWTPPGEGLYEICIESTPVPGETIIWNNYQCKNVNATSMPFTKVAVLRSYGTQAEGPKVTWDYLNAHWSDYGLAPISIDYQSLNTYPITYDAIAATDADVLVLSGSGYYYREPIGTELDDMEMAAIEKWVRSGRGFVAIGTAFHMNVSNNNYLTGLVGIADQPYATSFSWDIEVFPECMGHPLFRNVSSPFSNAFTLTAAPGNDGEWNVSDLDGGTMCARSIGNWPPPPGGSGGPIHTSVIVVNKGAVLMSFAADVMPNDDERQLLYNSFVWSRYDIFDYDAKVDMNSPRFIRPTDTALVSSIVSNIGAKDLPTVQVDLKVDGSVVDTQMVSNLVHMEENYVNFTWVPPSLGTYQICIFADIIGFTDEDPTNNEECMPLEVTDDMPIQVYVLDSWGTDFADQAPWDELNANWSTYGSARLYINYTRFNKERIAYQELVDSYADVLLISSSKSGNPGDPKAGGYYFSYNERRAIRKYVQEGNAIIGTGFTFDTVTLPEHGYMLGPLFGLKSGNLYYQMSGIRNLRIIEPKENHPLFTNMPDRYTTGNGQTLTPAMQISPQPPIVITVPINWSSEQLLGGEYKAISYPTENASVIVHEPGGYRSVYITNFVEKNSNENDIQLLYNAMVWSWVINPPTDLWIYKEMSTLRLEWNESTSARVQGYSIYRAASVNGFDFNVTYDTVPVGMNQWIDPQPDAGVDANNYFYVVRAYDERDIEEQNLNKVGKFVKQLYKGTNEISIGFELKDHSTGVAFESVDGLYKSVKAFDAETCVWYVWTPTGGSLTEIDRTMGLRVTMRSDGSLINVGRVKDTSIVLPEVSACANWNFVGYPSFVTGGLPGVLDNGGMARKYDLVLWFDPLDKKQHWKWFDPNDPGGSPLKELKPGMGIWIHVVQAGVWVVKGG